MKSLTLISTIHSENGKCNSDELCEIISDLNPEIVFLEALKDTYSLYEQSNFENFTVLHSKLEISAIQKYRLTNHSFIYIPVLDDELKSTFDNKYNVVCQNQEFQLMLNDFNLKANRLGFGFINSEEATILQTAMRNFENQLLGNNRVNTEAIGDIESYEDCMLQNIYSYIQTHDFHNAIFMCGVAHRLSLINKIKEFESKSNSGVNWNYWTGY
ncbi:hypothetical protein [Sediminibacterium sp.]|uniref:hypothetical protein n=1 Tax=Sediminibacterium sp. TaxID=1917865 RepID=UPI0025E4E267|nr:hypothetical protein [Sediminibacterium sp.]MBT9484336.1 hypothetical protein [Sediminibacterium sp.]